MKTINYLFILFMLNILALCNSKDANSQICPTSCKVPSLTFNTGTDISGTLLPLPTSTSPNVFDPLWVVTNAPSSSGLTLPTIPKVIVPLSVWGASSTTYSTIASNARWISPFPISNYATNNPPPDNPFTFTRKFCVCDADTFNFNGLVNGDDIVSVDVDGIVLLPWTIFSSSPPYAWQFVNNYNVNLFLSAGYHTFNIHLRNQGGSLMGINNNCTVTALSGGNFEAYPCCYSTGSINGRKYNDVNHNGAIDLFDTPMSGIQFNLTGPGGTFSSTTNSFGYYNFSGVPAGTYTLSEVIPTGWIPVIPTLGTIPVTVTVGGIFTMDFLNDTAPCNIQVAESHTNNSCYGELNGTASVSVSGGTTPYTYNWTPGNPIGNGTPNISNLSAGTYICTVSDANNCTNTITVTITEPSSMVVTAANVQGCTSCAIPLVGSPTGGTFSVPNPYTGASTSYTYTYTDPITGCTATSAPASITVANNLNVTGLTVTGTTGSSATLTWDNIPCIAWYTIRYREVGISTWTLATIGTSSKTITGLSSNTMYEVEISANCSGTIANNFSSSISFTTDAPCPEPSGFGISYHPTDNGRVTISWSAGVGIGFNYRYRIFGTTAWLPSSAGGSASTNAKTITGLTHCETYEIQVKQKCSLLDHSVWSPSYIFTTNCPKPSNQSSIQDVLTEDISIYPNPVDNVLTIEIVETEEHQTRILVMDAMGKMLKQVQTTTVVGSNNTSIDMSEYPHGLYIVQIFSNNVLKSTQKVTK
ncbi:MAG: T9SS type A sorting domain-containing protein [Chitinophagaceae bacterium]